MSPTPKSPSSLLRSLGADDAMLDTKLRGAAKEAEQRWPLFRALAPSKAEATPALSVQEKQVWEQAPVASATQRKPLLTRPGLSNKLAAGLEKFVPVQAAPARRSRTIPAAPAADGPSESAPRSNQRATPSAEVPATALGSAAPAAPPLAARDARSSPPTPTAPSPAPRKTPGLFGSVETKNEGTQDVPLGKRANVASTANPMFANITPSSTDDTLQALFARVEGREATSPAVGKGRATNPLMRRIGKR